VIPPAEIAHWLAGAVVLFIGLVLLSEAIVGPDVFRRRAWRAYLWPSVALVGGMLLWVVTVLSTFSIAGAIQLAVVRGKLTSPRWPLVAAAALLVSGVSFLIHESNPWLYARSAFLHHTIGWMLVVAALFPLGQALQPRRAAWSTGFALTFVALAVLLFADRDSAAIFGRFGAGGIP
jgi:hypothetical protein